jgi:hypothetical protein
MEGGRTPMQYATYKGERNLSALVARLFEIKGPRSEALTREAEEALLRTNPHLHDLKTVPEGTTILVPEIANIEPTKEVQPVKLPAGDLLKEMIQTLGSVSTALESAVEQEAEEVKGTLKAVKSPELMALARKIPALEERIHLIKTETETRLRENETMKTVQKKALARFAKDLDGFATRFALEKEKRPAPEETKKAKGKGIGKREKG